MPTSILLGECKFRAVRLRRPQPTYEAPRILIAKMSVSPFSIPALG